MGEFLIVVIRIVSIFCFIYIFLFSLDSKTNSMSTTLKSNPLITSTINNSNIDPNFFFELNHRDFHFFTDSQEILLQQDIPASKQSLIHNWMLSIFFFTDSSTTT